MCNHNETINMTISNKKPGRDVDASNESTSIIALQELHINNKV